MTKNIMLACCILGFALSAAVLILSIPSMMNGGEPFVPPWVAIGIAAGCGSAMFMLKRIGDT